MCSRFSVLISLILFSGCSLSDGESDISVFSASFNFNDSDEGWEPGFTDLPYGDVDSTFFELRFAHTSLPSNLGARKGIMLSGNNHSDDLFMFIKRKITGFSPNTSYTLAFEVELASNAPNESIGAGGSPGQSVYLKAGASSIEPMRTVYNDRYELNVDKGNQSASGANAVVLGDIGIPAGSTEYMLISRNNTSSGANSGDPFVVESNSAGEIWLLVGTDSGFEGITTVYYTKVNVLFSAPN